MAPRSASDHARGRAQFADDRLPVPAVAVLLGDRWRRRLDPGCRRARPRLPAKLAPGSEQGAGLPPRHRRERRDPDGQPDGGFHLLARLPRRRPQGLRRGRHHPQRRRPSDDLRRPLFAARGKLRASADIRSRRLGFVPKGEAGAFIAGHNTATGGRLPLNTNGGGLSYMHSGMYGMYALQESVRQMRGTAPPRSPMPRSRSAMVSAACSPPPAQSSWPTGRRRPRYTSGIPQLAILA